MYDQKDLRFQVPRPIRAPQNLAGLTWKGFWLLTSTSLFLGTLIFFLIQWWVDGLLMELVVKGVGLVIVIGICYQSFKVDEETGEMRVEFLLDRWKWSQSDHTVTPEWEGKPDVID